MIAEAPKYQTSATVEDVSRGQTDRASRGMDVALLACLPRGEAACPVRARTQTQRLRVLTLDHHHLLLHHGRV